MYDFKLQGAYILCNIRWKLGTPFYIEVTLCDTSLPVEFRVSDTFIQLLQSSS